MLELIPKNLECSNSGQGLSFGRSQGSPAIIESLRTLFQGGGRVSEVGIDFSNHISTVEMLMRDTGFLGAGRATG